MNTYVERPYSSILPITFGALPASVVTALLFLLMHSLIASDTPPIDEQRIRIAEIVRPDPKPIEIIPRSPPAKPVDAVPPPEWQAPQSDPSPRGSELAWIRDSPVIIIEKDGEVLGGGGIVAYLRPEPVYPGRALTRGIEGHVDLAFDIAATGSTTNIRVIDAQPSGVFEKAATTALKKWKYKVPVIDGEPQGQVDMMTRMSFELAE